MNFQTLQRTPVALVTGAGRRLGRVMALYLAERGFDLALHCHHSIDATEQLVHDINNCFDRKAAVFQYDLSQHQPLLGLPQRVQAEFGHLDLLINNASSFDTSSLRDADLDDLQKQFAINFTAPYILMAAFAKVAKAGLVVNMLDTNVVKAKVTHVNYLLSKKALHALTEMAAVELGPDFRVNGIAPGLILPPEDQDDDYLKRRAQNIPHQDRGYPECIIQALSYLIEQTFTTGQVLFVDGGESLAQF